MGEGPRRFTNKRVINEMVWGEHEDGRMGVSDHYYVPECIYQYFTCS